MGCGAKDKKIILKLDYLMNRNAVGRSDLFQFSSSCCEVAACCPGHVKPELTIFSRSFLWNNIYVIRYNAFSHGDVSNSAFTASALLLQSVACLRHEKCEVIK
jgi:hypothetical protein